MRQKKFWFTMSGILAVLAIALMLPTGAGAASKYKVLHRFTPRKNGDGGGPYRGVIFDTKGNLYGTTLGGGASRYGTVFKLSPNSDGSWRETLLYSFSGGTDGSEPLAGLVFDAIGNLYGTTYLGGSEANGCESNECGTVFKLKSNPDGSWTESVLHRFTGVDGGNPDAGLIFDDAGNLYGTTQVGGDFDCSSNPPVGCGVVFELTPNSNGSWTERVLATIGAHPIADLVFDRAGNLYGTAASGGDLACNAPFGCGDVFELTPNSDGTWTPSYLHNFTGADGYEPTAPLVLDSVGNLYGTTYGGGSTACNGVTSGCGVVFKLTPSSGDEWTEHVLHRFTGGNDGANPVAGLIFGATGNLYGTAEVGGAYGYGVVFELRRTSTGWKERVLHAFVGKPAQTPFGGLTLDKAGNLYGTATLCGSGQRCEGVVFEITP
jgi:uncharacterized repeat protein (TIGR03803 family)